MSRTYSIGCKQCRVYLWIGQSSERSKDGGYIYSAMPEKMALLQTLLFQHMGHPLVFDDDEGAFFDWTDMEPDVDDLIQTTEPAFITPTAHIDPQVGDEITFSPELLREPWYRRAWESFRVRVLKHQPKPAPVFRVTATYSPPPMPSEAGQG